jgi:uncharacterized membrane protein YraQ (UPF0718 family)
MPSWAIVVIAVVGTLLIYFLIGVIFYEVMKKKEPLVYAELAKLSAYEEERGKRVYEAIMELDRHGYNFDEESFALIKKGQESFDALSYEDKCKYKNTIDFTAFYLVKVHKEDKRYGKFITEPDAMAFKSYPEDSEEKYKAYNKAASNYNVFLNMISTKMVLALKREKRPQALIF